MSDGLVLADQHLAAARRNPVPLVDQAPRLDGTEAAEMQLAQLLLLGRESDSRVADPAAKTETQVDEREQREEQGHAGGTASEQRHGQG